jgi:predicted RNA-binding Zn ribbon-like protein
MHAFPCGTSALDFVGTLRARRNDVPTEKLDSPAALDAWFVESGLMDRSPRATAADLEQAVALREAVYRVVHARMMGAPFEEDDLRVVNAHAAGRPITLQLGPAGTVARAAEIAEGLSQLARQTVEIVGGSEGDVLRSISTIPAATGGSGAR